MRANKIEPSTSSGSSSLSMRDDGEYRIDVLPRLKILGRDFVEVRTQDGKEAIGRNVLLRGVNCGGNVKLPIGVRTQDKIDYVALKNPDYARNEITFVGRPFPLEDAPNHFRRISRWGFNCLRFLVTWEVSLELAQNKTNQ